MITNLPLVTVGLGPLELLVLLLPVCLWGFTVFEVGSSSFKDSSDKLVWLLIVLLLPVLGAILYYIFGKSKLAQE